MIIKVFRDNGTPDLNRWLVECDAYPCDTIAPLIGSTQWLIPAHPGMATYCPDCVFNLSACLIISALRCPGCGHTALELWRDNAENPHHYYAQCEGCGASLWSFDDEHNREGLADGWDLPPF